MLDVTALSRRYAVRRMDDSDAEAILGLCLENTQYYRYCGKQPSLELVLSDLHIAPPGVGADRKYYLGFFERGELNAVMDIIEDYPDPSRCFVGFFMMKKQRQGRGEGSALIGEVCAYLKETGFSAVRLGIDKGNPQSTHFWHKNGFSVIKEVERGGGTILLAEKTL